MTATRTLMLRAAKLLDEEAAAARDSCEGNGGRLWACSDCNQKICRAKTHHDNLVATAKALRGAA